MMGEVILIWGIGGLFFAVVAVVLSIPLSLVMAAGWMFRREEVFGETGSLKGDLRRLALSTSCKLLSILPAMMLTSPTFGTSWAIGSLRIVCSNFVYWLGAGILLEVASEFIRAKKRSRLAWVAIASVLIGALVGAELSFVASHY